MGRADLTVAALTDLIARGDIDGVAAIFDGASDHDRSRVRDAVPRAGRYSTGTKSTTRT